MLVTVICLTGLVGLKKTQEEKSKGEREKYKRTPFYIFASFPSI